MVSKVLCAMTDAAKAYIMEVEVDISRGLPDMEMTGNLGTSVRDGRERIRVAIKKSGYAFPQGRVTINIAPAAIRKEGTGFDLAMACGILSEAGILPPKELDNVLVVGELALDGAVKGIKGVLPMLLAAKRYGCTSAVIPAENYDEACLVEGIELFPAEYLSQIVDRSCKSGKGGADKNRRNKNDKRNDKDRNKERKDTVYSVDFQDISGQEYAKKAVLTAAAGMHNILLLGPPGAGKTMLASRIPTIMPDMDKEEGMELTCLYSVAGILKDRGNFLRRPFRAPHHSVTPAALAGGGRPVKPGEISLASKGVLFLDELTKYNMRVVELLREPLESGKILLNRMEGAYELPADFMLVTAMNPCRCGFYPDRNKCRCSPGEINRHYGKISKPILDRIDMSIQLGRISYEELAGQTTEKDRLADRSCEGWSSASMRRVVTRTWEIQNKRLGRGKYNSRMTAQEVRIHCALNEEAERIMKNAYERYHLSARAYHKILKVARTLADIEEREKIEQEHILEALGCRVREERAE